MIAKVTPFDANAARRMPVRALLVVIAVLLAACGGSGGAEGQGGAAGGEEAAPAEGAAGDGATAGAGGETTAAAGDGSCAAEDGSPTPVTLQLGWLASGNQLGEVVAMNNGYYADEGIELTIDPGGPSIDGVALVASGAADLGQVSSSPSLMLAASEGIPVKAFAVGAQEHPYAFFSMPDDPITAPEDMVGKTIGVQATGQILLDALFAEQGIDPSEVNVEVVGNEVTPLLTGQVDAFTGWLTNITQWNQLPEGYEVLRLWDTGVQLYALPYYATESTLTERGDLVECFLRATALGWQYARDNVEESVDMLVAQYPNLNREDELAAAEVMLGFVFTDATDENGWGTMDPEIWQRQIEQHDELGQFEGEPPTVDDVMTTEFLEATADARQEG